MSRQLLDLDEKQIADLAFRGASNRDIAAYFDCDEATIRNRFSALLHKKRAERRMDIRDGQTKAAKEGNAALLIWLGKQELDQTDKQIIQHAGHVTKELIWPDAGPIPDQDAPPSPGTAGGTALASEI